MIASVASRLCLTHLVLVALVAPTLAAPRDELLRYVPEDAGFCLVVQDLRGKSAQVMQSPFGQAFAKSTLATTILGSPEWKQLTEAEQVFKKHLGVGWAEVRDDLLGDAVVLAYRPGPPGKPEQDEGLAMLRAREARPLADFVRKLNTLQKDSGELKELVEREHKGVKYFRRVEKKETHYYLLSGAVLLFSGQESMIRRAIEREQALTKDTEPLLVRQLRDLGLDKASAALLIQPRTFDTHLAAQGDPGAKMIASAWKALDALGMGLTIGRDVEVSVVVKGKLDRLPPAARRLLTSTKASELWASFPEDALFATGGRVDFAALYELFGHLMVRESKQAADAELERTLGAMLGKSILKEVLPALGPDWGVCVLPPAESREWTPRILAAVRVARGDEDAPVDQALFSCVESWAQLFVLTHNKQNPGREATLRTTTIDRSRVRYLTGDALFPPGMQPAFGLRHGYLVLSSSLTTLRRFEIGAPVGESTPLMRVGVKALRAYLKDRREPLAVALAARENLTKEKAAARIDDLRTSLEMIDRVELRSQASGDRATFTLALTPAQAMKK